MKLQRLGILAGIALTATVALAACGTNNNNTSPPASSGSPVAGAIQCATGTLNAQGSTAQANAIANWIKLYNQQCPGATINYTGSGSGAGQQAFIAGQADFAGSDSPLSATDQPKANAHCTGGAAIHLPMVVGPIAVVYNVSGVSNLQFKAATLAGIFNGKITTWNDPAIAADNPGVSLPATKITPVHRSDSSGTTDNFTNYLGTVAGSTAWPYPHDKVWHAPGGDAEKGSDGVSKFLSSTDGAIGYVEWSFATLNNLNMAKIFNGAGEWSTLSADSAGKTIAGAQVTGTGNDLQMKIDYNTSTAGAYPIVLVTYEIVCDKGNPSGTLNLLKSFLSYTASTAGQATLTQVGSAPLPDSVRTKVASIVSSMS
ncbi:MAG TPA: phosphate ABC transporter substrate-binding protein PstS [Micromonosporaceae bacterium]|nr:phosphate ABC transporter substrate-binding protein PstS [Micromonosporaceae bacterium]